MHKRESMSSALRLEAPPGAPLSHRAARGVVVFAPIRPFSSINVFMIINNLREVCCLVTYLSNGGPSQLHTRIRKLYHSRQIVRVPYGKVASIIISIYEYLRVYENMWLVELCVLWCISSRRRKKPRSIHRCESRWMKPPDVTRHCCIPPCVCHRMSLRM